MKSLAITAVAVLSGAMASPGEALRGTLADPVEPGYVEVQPGTPGAFEGAFTADQYGDYAALTDPSVRQQLVDALKTDGFVAGYAREWNLQNTADYLGEIALQFKTPSGAKAAASSSKAQYAAEKGFQGYIETKGVADAFGVTFDGVGGYQWTIVVFAKGHNAYAVAGGSPDDYRTAGTLAQAQREYAFAPSDSSTLVAERALQPWRVATVLILVLALMAATGVALVIFWPRRASGRP